METIVRQKEEKKIKSKQGETIEITTQSDKRSVPFPWLVLPLA